LDLRCSGNPFFYTATGVTYMDARGQETELRAGLIIVGAYAIVRPEILEVFTGGAFGMLVELWNRFTGVWHRFRLQTKPQKYFALSA
jgi:hypothetical protein